MPTWIRGLAKSLVQGSLTSSAGLRALQWLGRGRRVILGYHNVIPDDEPVTGEPSVHIRLSEFEWQVEVLRKHCDIVPLNQILESAPGSVPARLRAAITFDDAYAGAIRLAVPKLASENLPSTVFVPSGFVGGSTFWWDDLQCSGWEGERIPLERLAGRDAMVRNWAGPERIKETPQAPSQRTATKEDLFAVRSLPGVTFGVHTVGHPNLARLRDREIHQELVGNLEWIRGEGLPLSNWVAYPYGLANSSVTRIAEQLGFDGGLLISGGWIPRNPTSHFLLPRAVVPSGIPRSNFLIRLYGVVSG